MGIIEKVGLLLRRKSVLAVLLVVTIVVVVAAVKNRNAADDLLANEGSKKPVVSLITSAQYSGGQSLSLIGDARAFTEANVTAERGGRVVSVNVKLGQAVKAGQIIATLENASERAAMLQVEGVYDAAIAASAQSGVGVDEAANNLRDKQNGAVNSIRSAYNTTNGVVLNTIDSFFSSPNSFVPGLRIEGKGYTATLNSERLAYQTLLPNWKSRVDSVSADSDLESELGVAKENVERTITIVDTFISVFNNQSNSSRYTDAELAGFSSTFTGLRASLLATQSSLDSALNSLKSAKEGVKRAELSSTGGVNSASDAQIKQALGSLRAAQANLAKTILRTPVSGTVNSLDIKTGDFINAFTPVAIVANNSALEIITSISDSELSLLSVGDEVAIEGKYTGVVAQIAPAVNGATRKTEVRIAVEDTEIKNGDTVRITKELSSEGIVDAVVRVPLTAVKFERENGFVFSVVDGKVSKIPVELGAILGNSVEIISGLNSDAEFVQDARGLVDGEGVEIAE